MATTKLQPYNLATNLLGYSEASVDGQTVTDTDVTGCSVTVDVPAGGRSIKITGLIGVYSATANQLVQLTIQEGATLLGTSTLRLTASNKSERQVVMAVLTPTAGSHTYKLHVSMESAAGNIDSNTGYKGFILVEVI